MIDPIRQFKQDWQLAKEQGDASAKYCTLATLEHPHQVATRTLVLREVTADSFIVYVNRSSAKWPALSKGTSVELLIFWPSLMRQYRVRGVCRELPTQTMREHWARKPYESKLLDHYYLQRPQSSKVESREVLLQELALVRERFPADEDIPYAANATGVVIEADYIEAWQASVEDHIHKRCQYTLTANGWKAKELVP